MKKFLIVLFSALLLFYCACWRLPATRPLALENLPLRQSALLLPLDSRPVCSVLPQELGALAGIKVIVPPVGFLDNYTRPAETEKLYLWCRDHLDGAAQVILAADLMVHGGLLASRLPLGGTAEQERFLQFLAHMENAAPATAFSVFSIVPRLLVSDQLTPDCWYQWHLMRYAQLRDLTETFGDLAMTLEQEQLAARIPPQILQKYLELYRSNDLFNKAFAALSGGNMTTVIGQDDGDAFGLPNRNLNRAKMYCANRSGSYTTYGADEIAAVLLARTYLQRQHFTPKIYVQYAAPSMAFLYMPFMAASVGETLRDKMRLLGAAEVSSREAADIVLYVNCGNANYRPNQAAATELRNLLGGRQHLALLDLTANFQEEELLMPVLLAEDVPVHRLAAYAGWNTCSNSAGTVLAQAVIFAGRCREVQPEELPALYAANLRFLLSRLLDDYVYQKTYHADLQQALLARGLTPDNLDSTGQAFASHQAQAFITRRSRELLHYHLGRTPFYMQGGKAYYLRDVQASIYFPWQRIFEIGLDVRTETGVREQR